MRKFWKKILLLVICLHSALWVGSSEVSATEEVFPFGNSNADSFCSDIWVGDKIELKDGYTYDIAEGSEKVEMLQEERITIHFLQTGTVKLNATRNSDMAEKVFEFIVHTPKTREFNQLIPSKIKVGYDFSSSWFVYKNCLLRAAGYWTEIYVENYSDLCMLPGENYGIGTDNIRRNVENAPCAENLSSTGRWQWLRGVATKPGTIYYTSGFEPNNKRAIVIEEPVVESNLPKEIKVGTTMQLETSLANTMLTDKKVEDVISAMQTSTYLKASNFVGYQPRLEIISGSELVKRGVQDYSCILSTKEQITFVKEGTVTFKVVYEMLPVEDSDWHILEDGAIYSPEKIFSVKVVKENESTQEQTSTKEENINDKTEKETSKDTSQEVKKENSEKDDIKGDIVNELASIEELGEEVKGDITLDYTKETNLNETAFLEAIQSLTENQKVSVNLMKGIVIDSSVLNALKEGKHEIVVNQVTEKGELVYSWSIRECDEVSMKWNTSVQFDVENIAIERVIDKAAYEGAIKTIHFQHQGKLPGQAHVKIFVGDKFPTGATIYYYYFNVDANKVEKIDEYVVDALGYVTVVMEHCSDYILTEGLLTEDVKYTTNTALNDKVSSNVLASGIGIGCVVGISVITFWVYKRKRGQFRS